MAFCRKCGKEINDEAVICVHCGCQTEKGQQTTTVSDDKAKTSEILCSILVPIVGVILFFVLRNERPNAAKSCLIAGLVTWLIMIFLLML